jgi:hypothetical protein
MNANSGSPERFLQATMHPVVWFWKRFQSDELELQPVFQRNPVWQDKQKAYLIDTILRGYPIPEIYLQREVDPAGNEKYVVVDGQQRIRACLEFIAGEVALGEESGTLSGSFFDDLSQQSKQAIFEYRFLIRDLPSLSDPEIREIFGRLNRNNVALNPQELRHATYWGEFISSMTEISRQEFWVTSGLFTSNDIRRMLDIEFISEIAIAQLFGLQNKKSALDKFYERFETEFPDRQEIEETFAVVLGEISQILDWPSSTRWSKKTDFYSLFLVLARHRADIPFDREVRDRLRTRLDEFSSIVGALLSSSTDDDEGALAVRAYARGVARAASDLGSRKMRDSALESYLFDTTLDVSVDTQDVDTAEIISDVDE